ncbi:MAG TPA: branched-chain amino acid ABC transporter permease/ATP-binding protein [Streptosporangiaceae bacterium]
MQQILLFILLGLGSGALIAGLALAVVLTYRGSGIINLATGGVAMLAGYAYWALRTGRIANLPTAPALVVSLLFALIIGAAIELIVFRPLRNAAPLAKLVSSLGVLLVAQASMLLAFGTTAQPEPSVLPTSTVRVFSAVIPVDRFILTGVVIVVTGGLAAFYRWTRFGLATRAASENEVAAMLGGLSPNLISLVNTLLAALVAGSIGILAASITQLDSRTLPLQIVPALAAALLAGFSSFGIACAAGIGIGIGDSLINYAASQSWFPASGGVALPGVTDLLAFVIIVLAMFLRGARLPGRGELVERRLPEAPRPRHLAATSFPLFVLGAIALVVLPFDFREALINSLIGTLMALSLVVITGFVGQISVVQLTLAGVTGFTISHLAVGAGIGFPLGAVAGVLAAVVFGLATAFSALRVRGVSLAVVTLAAAVAIENFGFVNTTWGGGQAGSPVPEPRLFGLDLGTHAGFRGLDGNQPSPVFGWAALCVCVMLCLSVGLLRRGPLGRRMLAVRSNERAAAAVAINPRAVKLLAFGIAAFIAGVAGSLYAYNFGSVSADRFDAVTALGLIAFAYAGGITLISGAVFAGLISAQALLPYALDKWFGLNGNWFLLFGGVVLILTLLQNPEGVAGAFYKRFNERTVVPPPVLDPPPRESPRPGVPRAEPRPGHAVLRVTGLSVAFGGVHALSDVSLEVRPGELVGLIGPNGAGKTTLIDAISGFVGSAGHVELAGSDLGGLPPYERARLGLARTWQSTELFEDLDVRENLVVSSRHLHAEQALDLVHMRWAADVMPGQLSAGQRKFIGLARALASGPALLCLDEPASGLDTRETAELGRCLRALADDGQSMLLIEHDMGLVLSICDRVVVLEFGRVIFDDTPRAARDDPRVIAAYLGAGPRAQPAPEPPPRM